LGQKAGKVADFRLGGQPQSGYIVLMHQLLGAGKPCFKFGCWEAAVGDCLSVHLGFDLGFN
jgi:hypothetical protein